MDLYNIRKKLHRTPEIAFQEFKTQEIIIEELKKFPQLTLTKLSPTGLLYKYEQGLGDYLLFRADMDALPIDEKTNCDYQSLNAGFCHACGHDVHMTILLGLINYVLGNKLSLNLLFLFQPAEEGLGGAKKVIDSHVLEQYNIKAAYTCHVSGQFPTGTIALNKGLMMGIPQEFDINILGKSGHVSTPFQGRDAFLAGVTFYQTILQLLPKRFPIQEPIIFHIGKIISGTVRNIIPETCRMEGTFRCLKKNIQDGVIQLMNEVSRSIEQTHQVQIIIDLLCSYEPVINNEQLVTQLIQNIPEKISVIHTDYSLTGEDFGFFSNMFPSVLFWLGTNSSEDLHSAKFLADEKSIDVGIDVFKSILI